ncbi:MAG: 4-hydroxy-3-methylbut-2-enyl diphosphate reductase, partial [Acutalibacter sp.]|nr:4-hydroxy-3-methylbut-2-enyl diphosphate reductase [Acutalibacter sp.]
MTVHLAKSAGFCFGAKRAVDMVYDLLEKGKKPVTLGA